MTTHELLGGKVQVFKRSDSPLWHCRASVGGAQHRASTKTDSLSKAKEVAADWYLELEGKNRWGGGIATGRTFTVAANKFVEEYEIITRGERSPIYVEMHKRRIRVHLLPYFGKMRLGEITPGLVQAYRAHRMTKPDGFDAREAEKHAARFARWEASKKEEKGEAPTITEWKPPSRSTLHQEIVSLRQILKTAERHGWIDHVPSLAAPYKASGKISHRGWFSPTEYRQLYLAASNRSKTAHRADYRANYQHLYDFIIFMANTGLRPDEALRLEVRDVSVVKDTATGERILEIEVRGKRGLGYCKSMPSAVAPFLRLKKACGGGLTDRLFDPKTTKLLTHLLRLLKLKTDRDGQPRAAYSLRHTYICLRLMEGADIYQIAKNCRTSVEMIEKYYASHLKNTLDASAINVMRAKPVRKVTAALTPTA